MKNRLRYLLSDNPACAGRFFSDDYKPKLHDNSNITRCKTEANKIKLKLQANMKDKITEHDVSLFSVNTGKLVTGLSCHHNFNSAKRHEILFGIEKDFNHFIEELHRVSAKYWAIHKIGSKSKSPEARKKKEQKKKGNKRRITSECQ